MTKKSFISIVKDLAGRYCVIILQKSSHLKEELIIDPKGGFFWWLQTHRQKLALEKAMQDLLQDARKPNFQLAQVTEKLSLFKLKKDDAGQAQWYKDAHTQLLSCQKTLDEASLLKRDMINPALTELKYISEADHFHQYFQLQPLQRRVRHMYEAITERLDVLLDYTKLKNQEHKTEVDVREQEVKLKQAEQLTAQHQIQLAQEATELKKAEVERDLIEQQHQAKEASWERESAQRQLSLQEAQEKHRLQLQESMADFQQADSDSEEDKANNELPRVKAFIGKDGLIDISAEQHLEALLRRIKNDELDRSDPKIKEQLQALLQAIAGL
jgi:hypothetical protein